MKNNIRRSRFQYKLWYEVNSRIYNVLKQTFASSSRLFFASLTILLPSMVQADPCPVLVNVDTTVAGCVNNTDMYLQLGDSGGIGIPTTLTNTGNLYNNGSLVADSSTTLRNTSTAVLQNNGTIQSGGQLINDGALNNIDR